MDHETEMTARDRNAKRYLQATRRSTPATRPAPFRRWQGRSPGVAGRGIDAGLPSARALQTPRPATSLWGNSIFPVLSVGGGPEGAAEKCRPSPSTGAISRSPSNEIRPIRRAFSTSRTAICSPSSKASRTPPLDGPRSRTIPDRYLRVDPASSREQYRWMERFVASVSDQALRERLLVAIDGKGAFRRFKDVLLAFPAERERWFAYRSDLLHFHIQTWLEHMQDRGRQYPPLGTRRAARGADRAAPAHPIGRGAWRDPAAPGPRAARRDTGGGASVGAGLSRVPSRPRHRSASDRWPQAVRHHRGQAPDRRARARPPRTSPRSLVQ